MELKNMEKIVFIASAIVLLTLGSIFVAESGHINLLTGAAVIEIQSTPGNTDACQSLDTVGVYTLTQNVANESICFKIMIYVSHV